MTRKKTETFRVDTSVKNKVFVRKRSSNEAVACFKHTDVGNHSVVVVCQAVAHALTLEDRQKGIYYWQAPKLKRSRRPK